MLQKHQGLKKYLTSMGFWETSYDRDKRKFL